MTSFKYYAGSIALLVGCTTSEDRTEADKNQQAAACSVTVPVQAEATFTKGDKSLRFFVYGNNTFSAEYRDGSVVQQLNTQAHTVEAYGCHKIVLNGQGTPIQLPFGETLTELVLVDLDAATPKVSFVANGGEQDVWSVKKDALKQCDILAASPKWAQPLSDSINQNYEKGEILENQTITSRSAAIVKVRLEDAGNFENPAPRVAVIPRSGAYRDIEVVMRRTCVYRGESSNVDILNCSVGQADETELGGKIGKCTASAAKGQPLEMTMESDCLNNSSWNDSGDLEISVQQKCDSDYECESSCLTYDLELGI